MTAKVLFCYGFVKTFTFMLLITFAIRIRAFLLFSGIC